MSLLIRTLRAATSALSVIDRVLGAPPPAAGGAEGPAEPLVRRADDARAAGRTSEAVFLYRQALGRDRYHARALRSLRELAVQSGRWHDAVEPQRRLVAVVPSADRPLEAEWLAIIHYQLGQARMAAGAPRDAIAHFRDAVRADRRFVPATVALGDAYETAGDRRQAMRLWERAVDVTPVLPILARLERAYRHEGRPARMIELYQRVLDRAPEDVALAVALGRVLFELEMLEEAAEHFEKLELRAPDVPAVHAFLGAIFERRGQFREAFEEYRRGVHLALKFGTPHRCSACGLGAPTWQDRCAGCGRWNTLRP
jgi:lipopolysaccharide biosynthesis regulator YciM